MAKQAQYNALARGVRSYYVYDDSLFSAGTVFNVVDEDTGELVYRAPSKYDAARWVRQHVQHQLRVDPWFDWLWRGEFNVCTHPVHANRVDVASDGDPFVYCAVCGQAW